MALKLTGFRTQNFRSIANSGWIEVDDVTALVGINESGKSNLLLSLWKLNPAREGGIDPIADYPRHRYHEIRAMKIKPVFVTARFTLDDSLATEVANRTQLAKDMVAEVEISRRLSGEFVWSFPQCQIPRSTDADEVKGLIESGRKELDAVAAFQTEGDLKERMMQALTRAEQVAGDGEVDREHLMRVIQVLKIDLSAQAKTSKLGPVFEDIIQSISRVHARLDRPAPTAVEGLWKLVWGKAPKFVYYSNYGNLDSEIYLPHVIENLERDDLGEKEAAKARTLKVLFEFVKLEPQEILELGEEVDKSQLTEDDIEADARKKKEREILLTSASTQLTEKFRNWWKQGDYRFRFNADGNHFRIWVSDDARPEEIELEGRSTGLQWFLSFYLVFLVETEDAHAGTILLLDEAGLSLHPLAQRDLTKFFDSLENQVIYTTHSPFLMEADALDRVRSVYVDAGGRTVVSPNLRANPQIQNAKKSIYPVHVAMGLSVSDTFLIGCIPIVVEGTSDQRYLTAIKNYLIGKSRISPKKDIVFLPAGGTGTKGIAAVVSIVTAKEEELPKVLLDSDGPGSNLRTKLISGVYKGFADRVKQVGDYGLASGSEVEDVVPSDELSKVVTRYLPRPAGSDEEFEDVVDSSKPIVPQIEAYCQVHNINLPDGWKVEVATMFKNRLGNMTIDKATEDCWTTIFEDFLAGTD